LFNIIPESCKTLTCLETVISEISFIKKANKHNNKRKLPKTALKLYWPGEDDGIHY